MKRFHLTADTRKVLIPLVMKLNELIIKDHQVVGFTPMCAELTPLINAWKKFISDKQESDLYFEVPDYDWEE